MDDVALRQSLGQAAVKNAGRFAWEVITEELFQVYQEA
jgi:hypothetical protein